MPSARTMEVLKGNGVLIGIVSAAERDQIPSEIATKIDMVLDEKFEELLTNKALMETARYNAEQSVGEYKEKYEALKAEQDSLSDKLQAINGTNAELQTQFTANVNELAGVRTQCTELESEVARMRHERYQAIDERDVATAMVKRRDGELSRIQADLQLLQEQLHAATAARCEAQAQLGDNESRQLTLDYKEKRLDQERQLFTTQIRALEEQLAERTEEVLNMRRDTTSRCVLLETRLTARQEELRLLQEEHRILQEEHTEQLERNTQQQKEQYEEKRVSEQAMEAFQAEVEAQRKLADLYRLDAVAKSAHVHELEAALEEARVRLDEAVERYGDLETTSKEQRLASEEMLSKKAECITLLRKELETANDLLSSAGGANYAKVEDMFPQAATTSRLLNDTGNNASNAMSLTQIYNQYVRTSELLVEEREETDRLRGYIRKIVQELQEKGPLLARQRDDLERAVATVEQLTQTHDQMVQETDQLRSETQEHKRRANRESAECDRFRVQLGDLGRQVCKLLQQRDLLTNTDAMDDGPISSQDIISKRLVTFSSIAELQSNNQRLLAVVRELSAKQEQQEHHTATGADADQQLAQMQEQLERLREAHSDLLEQQTRQHKLTRMLTGQRDTYKTLYQQAVKNPVDGDVPMQLERPFIDGILDTSSIDGDSHSTIAGDNKALEQLKEKVQQLETELAKAHKHTEQLTNENDTYRKEKSANEKILIEVNERLRQETQQLTQQNTKLTATLDTNQLQLQTAKRNRDGLRKQFDSLEERNRIYTESQVKLETSVTHYKDQVYESMTKLAKAEVLLSNLQKENALLRDAEARLSRERETFRSECQSIKVLHTNMALIKATLERSDAESRIRLEESVTEAQRECSALRRRLQEEQDRFRALVADLELKTQTAQQRMEEERTAADKLRLDLSQTRDDLQAKTAHIRDLTNNMQRSIQSADATTLDGRKYREMEQLLHARQCELDALRQKLDVAKEALEQHSSVAEEASKQLTFITQQQTVYRTDAEKQIEEQRNKIATLEEKCADLEAELSLHRSEEMNEQTAVEGRVTRLQQRLNTALDQVKDLEATNAGQSSELAESRKLTEEMGEKYSREVALHSDDLRNLRTLKQTMETIETEVRELRFERTKLLEEQVEKENGWKTRDELMLKETTELQRRFEEIMAQNTLLHDQIQEMNSNLSVLQVQSDQLNNSTSTGNVSLNRSLNEDDVKSADQLVKIIKYLRHEKDVALSKAEIIESEQTRMRLELEIAHKQLHEARAAVEAERQKSETSLIANAKYADVLRKVETMNAITDSNRSLRSERDGLLQQVGELRGENGKLEEQVAPLQERLAELQRRSEALQSENTTLRGEATRWRQRANTLIEKTNRTSPEDWKKLQTERETLAKQLTIERANIVRLNDDLATMNREKGKLEEDGKTLHTTCSEQKEELAKLAEELGALRTELHAMQAEIQQGKAEHGQLNADQITLAKELSIRDGQLADQRTQLAQVRKIAKKYKMQYEEMQKTVEEQHREDEEKTAEATAATESVHSELTERITRLEEDLKANQETSNTTIATLTAENQARLQEMERSTQTMQTNKERFAQLIKNAKDRIMELTEQRDNAVKQLEQHGNKEATADVATAGPSGDGNSSASTSGSGEGTATASSVGDSSSSSNGELITRLERIEQEKDSVMAEQVQERERHGREVEELRERLAQLQRLLEESGSGGSVDNRASVSGGVKSGASVVELSLATSHQQQSANIPPTANIKPMAGHMTQAPHGHGTHPHPHMPMASIRPLHPRSATVTVTVPPTTQPGPSTLAVPPQQVQVHTTAGTGVTDNNNSSPTSSHTDTQQQPQQAVAMVLPRTVTTVDSGSSSSSTSSTVAVGVVSATSQPSQTSAAASIAAAVVVASQSQSSSSASSAGSSGSGSSSTVTTSGVKRMRDDSDSTTTTTVPSTGAAGTAAAPSVASGSGKVQAQVQPLVKRSRLLRPQQAQQQQPQQQQIQKVASQVSSQQQQQQQVEASDDGTASAEVEADETVGEVEYQVPTSSQRDHDDDVEEDMEDVEDMQVINLVESDEDEDDEDNAEADAEAAAAEDEDEEDGGEDMDDDGEDPEEEEEDDDDDNDDEMSNDDGPGSRRKRRRRGRREVEVDDEEAMEEEQEDDNEDGAAVVDDEGDDGGVVEDEGDEAAAEAQEVDEDGDGGNADGGRGQRQMEATSSSATATSSSTPSRQQVAPMSMSSRQQQQQLLLPEECTDDGIVPSTPTLFVPRRGGSGGGDGVSSPHPHVPTVAQGRLFTFSTEQAGGSTGGEQEVQQGNDVHTAAADDSEQTGRSVPNTPHQLLQSPPPGEAGAATGGSSSSTMGPPTQTQQVEGSEEAVGAMPFNAVGTEDEGREAEATPTVGQQTTGGRAGMGTGSGGGVSAPPTAVMAQRRSTRPVSSSSGGAMGQGRQVTPIVWDQQQHHHTQHMAPSRSSPRHPDMMGGAIGAGLSGRGGRGGGPPVQRARRSRGAMIPRGGYSRY